MNPSEKKQLAQAAHRKVQSMIVAMRKSQFVHDSLFTYPANTVEMDLRPAGALATATAGDILAIRDIGMRSLDEDVSVTNGVSLLTPYQTNAQTRGGNYPAVVLNGGAWGTEVQNRSGVGGCSMSWGVRNRHSLFINPVPTADVYLIVYWTPLLKFAADDAIVLGGYLPPADDLVVYKTAEMYARALGYTDYAEQAQRSYDSLAVELPNFVDVMPSTAGTTQDLADRRYMTVE